MNHPKLSNLLKASMMALAVTICGLSSTSRAAGGQDGGGGKGVVCRSENGAVKSVELLELWEAKTLGNKKIVKSDASVDAQVKSALIALSPALNFSEDVRYSFADADSDKQVEYRGNAAFARSLESEAAIFLKPSMRVLRQHGIKLVDTADSFEDAMPTDCQIEQLVRYKDAAQLVMVNQDLVDHMNSTNKAALIVHEVFYSYLRTYHRETNSLRVRRAVGAIFAGERFQSLRSIVPPVHVECSAEGYQGFGANTVLHLFHGEPGSGVHIVVESGLGKVAIGYQSTTNGWNGKEAEMLLNGTPCTTPKERSVGKLLGSAPVDFDQDFGSLSLVCKNSKILAYVTPRANYSRLGIANENDSQLLNCRSVSK